MQDFAAAAQAGPPRGVGGKSQDESKHPHNLGSSPKRNPESGPFSNDCRELNMTWICYVGDTWSVHLTGTPPLHADPRNTIPTPAGFISQSGDSRESCQSLTSCVFPAFAFSRSTYRGRFRWISLDFNRATHPAARNAWGVPSLFWPQEVAQQADSSNTQMFFFSGGPTNTAKLE